MQEGGTAAGHAYHKKRLTHLDATKIRKQQIIQPQADAIDALHQQEYRPEQQHYQQPLQRESAQLALVTGEPAGGKQCGITFQQRWHDQARREETLKQ